MKKYDIMAADLNLYFLLHAEKRTNLKVFHTDDKIFQKTIRKAIY